MCLNEGCIPSKALLYSAKVYDYALHGEKYGVKTENASLDHKAVVARRGKVVRTLVSGVGAENERRGCHRGEGARQHRGPRGRRLRSGSPRARSTRPSAC